MQIESLKVFTDLVETESFSKAARLNNITQSAVSQQARALEKQLNASLIERKQKALFLTPEGRRFYESCQEVLQIFEKLTSDLQNMHKVLTGNVTVATIYSIGFHSLPTYVKKFLLDYPMVNVRVEYRRSSQIYDDVAHNAVDIGLVAFPRRARNIEVVPYREEEMVVVCSPHHPLAKEKSIEVAQLARFKLIGFDPETPTRQATNRFLQEAKVPTIPSMEFDNVETVKSAVEINSGIAILPQGAVVTEVHYGALNAIPFKNRSFKQPMAILYRRGRDLPPVAQLFMETLTGPMEKKRKPKAEEKKSARKTK